MATAKGSDVQFMIIEESSWGATPATPSGYVIGTSGLGGDWYRRGLIANPELRGNRNPQAPVRGNVVVNGSASVPLHLDSIGWILKHGIGTPATSGSPTYTHLSKMNYSAATEGGDLPVGLTVEIGFTDVGEYHQYTGCKIGSLTVNATSEGVAVFDVGFTGQDFTRSATSLDSTPTKYTSTAIDHFAASIEEGGASSSIVTDVNLTVNNGLDSSMYVIGGSGQLGALPEGMGSVTGSLTALFQDNTLLAKATGHTESSLQLKWTSGASSLTWLIPELVYEPAAPPVTGSAGVRVVLNFQGYYANHADKTALKSTLVNTVATY